MGWVIPSPWTGGECRVPGRHTQPRPKDRLSPTLFEKDSHMAQTCKAAREFRISDIRLLDLIYIPWDSPDIQSLHLQNKYWLSSGKGMSISLSNAKNENWKGNLKLFSEDRGSDNGRTGGLTIVKLLTELQSCAPVCFPLYLFSLFFFCCIVLSLCLLPLLLSRLFGHCPTAKCQTYLTMRSPLPCGRQSLSYSRLVLWPWC